MEKDQRRLEAFVNPHSTKKKLGLTEWLSIIQIIALLIGGGWAAFQFWKYDAREKELTSKKSEIDLRRMQATPIKIESTINIEKHNLDKKSENDQLDILFNYSITNTTGQRIKVVMIEVNALLLPNQSVKPNNVVEIPEVRLSADSPWSKVISRLYLATDETLPNGKYFCDDGSILIPVSFHGATGFIEPNAKTWGSITLYANQLKADYIGFNVSVLIRFENKSERWHSIFHQVRLLPDR